ncbi:MAG: hypothetical protein CME71_01660 [Halobacteriovorax sp.]|nr:hypothetical protein [Halobacteriovorax sp.]|tara:strand:+ start:51 stop:260 length:210 start_codon:yes stop_codon:yes gene_type:complete
MTISYEEAVKKLQKAVKTSHIDNQKHIDLTLVDPSQRADLQKALMFVKAMIVRGEISDSQFKSDVGLEA